MGKLVFRGLAFLALLAAPVAAQNAALVGSVKDPQDAVVPNATVTLTNLDTNVSQTVNTNVEGGFEFSFAKPGRYSLKVQHAGFQTFQLSEFMLTVDERARIDASLQIGEASTVVTVESSAGGVQTESASLGTVVTPESIAQIPLNGRFFLDLALLQAGTVVPSTNNRTFLAVPSGIGISGINASGTREDSTNYLFDGINISDMTQNQITFQPNIESMQEFKVQTNAFSAEYGRNAGIIVNGVSKSGSNGFHGTAFEFVRNEKFDAKNYFDSPTLPIAPFKRNIFGYSVGGPIKRNRTFFFTSYEGRQGREVTSLKTLVPTQSQRATVTNPIAQKLLALVPPANDPTGGFFIGVAPRRRTLNQFTGRVDHSFSEKDRLFGNFISNRDSRTEITVQGNNLPGFGDFRPAKRYLLALGETHIFTPSLTNEFRAGLNRVRIDFIADDKDNPAAFGIASPSTVFPNINVAGGALRFGGEDAFPQGRGDTTFQYSDTVSWIRGKQSIRFGAEFRRFRNNNFNGGTGGTLSFGTLAGFLAGTPTSATETALPATPALRVSAFGSFVEDDVKVTRKLTLNLGLRWEYNGVPYETHNRLGVYDFGRNKVIPIGTGGIERPYQRQFTNFGPRVGFAYDPFGRGKTVVRAGAGLYYDQPVTNMLTAANTLGNNPPFSASVNNTSNINLANPFAVPPGGGSAIGAVDPNFKSGRVLSYNFNLQQEVLGTVIQAAYVGSQGRHLRVFGDYNQGINGVRPIPGFSSIRLQESASSSNYNGLWISADKRLAKGLSFATSYTFSKSIDNNSVGSSDPQMQDFRNFRAERALSDFDARHRFALSGTYRLPLHAAGAVKRAVEGWSASPILNMQSGNPFSPIIAVTDTKGSLEAFNRPNYVAGVPIYLANPSPAQWVNPKAFLQQATGFGNVGRNTLTSPGFLNVDFSVDKTTAITEKVGLQFRAEVFNILNHPNFGQPINSITASNFGQITATRAARGDLGSSRQIQLGIKLLF